MNNIFKYVGATLVGAFALAACSPEDYGHLDPNGIPSLEGIDVVPVVDQDLNQVTFALPADLKGVLPVWIFDGKTYSTVNGLQKIFNKAGDYTVEYRLMNRNGISDGSKTATFHIDNTKIDFGKYTTLLCGGVSGSTKEWRIDNEKKGHLGCGPSGTTGLEWWSAGPDEKADFGVYDCRMTFGSDMTYSFNPGASGQIYVNKDVAAFGGAQGQTDDFCVDAQEQTVSFEFDSVGEDLYLVLPEHTFFPYIANDDIWNSGRYRIESMTASEINLVIDNGGIAWHYILTSGAAKEEFAGFTYDQADNIWKNATVEAGGIYYADGSWTPYPNNGDAVFTVSNQEIVASLPLATVDRWQAQFPVMTNIVKGGIDSSHTYDFSCVIQATKDLKGATLKLVEDGENGQLGSLGIAYDANFVFDHQVDLKAYEDVVVYLLDQPGIDLQDNPLKLVLDFGGNQEETIITIKDIVLIDHAKNTELNKVPTDNPGQEGGVIWADVDSPANLMTAGKVTLASCWWADDNWSQVAEPQVAIDGRNVKITAASNNGGLQWQGQVHLNTGVAIEEGKAYDFSITLTPSQDLGGATVKPHPEGDDGHFFSEGRHDLAAYTDNVVTYENFVSDFSTGNLVITLDFPGCAEGAEIEVKNIIIQEHNEAQGGGNGNWVDVNSADNLMTAGKLVLNSNWWADNGWGPVAEPTVTINGNTALIVANASNGGLQWQGQCHFGTGAAMETGVSYDFSITINPTADLYGATVKPHPEGDDGHFISEGRHDLAAYVDNKVTYTGFVSDFSTGNLVITLDFPGCPEGTEIEVKDIILQKSK